MKDKILHKASELFISFGFKSVTMDDIANDLGMSKKTIYQHFSNKTKLVEAATLNLFNFISSGINDICSREVNPIIEIYEIKKFVMLHLKDEKSSPQYQLQKYYPKLYLDLKKKQFEVMQSCVITNINRGISQGLYRSSIDPEFISRIYFSGMIAIKDNEIFPTQMFTINTLMESFIEYHLRAICTQKGLDQLNTIKNNN